MKNKTRKKRRMGIVARTTLLSWLVTIVTVTIFMIVIIPYQKQIYIDNLESKAHVMSTSIRDVAAGAVVTEDYSAVVDHCMEIVNGDSSVSYIVITRNDGFSLIHKPDGWVMQDLDEAWMPAQRKALGGITQTDLIGEPSFHYKRPFDYSGIEWGWIHIGLSLDAYDKYVAAVYSRTGLIGVICILIGLGASYVYAQRLVGPILSLQRVVQRVTGGDLNARVLIDSGDEIGNLGNSVNQMSEALQHRDRILQTVRFAAEEFLRSDDWKDAVDGVLAALGESADASRVYIFENHLNEGGASRSSQRFEWAAEGVSPEIANPDLQNIDWEAMGLAEYYATMSQGHTVVIQVSQAQGGMKALMVGQGILSMALVPIFEDKVWWGFIGLDDCRVEREWSEAEMDSLSAAADTLGAAILRKRTQDALLIAKEEAEAASEAKSLFLANMSHEIRTPINGVVGMLKLLRNTNLEDKQSSYVQTAISSADTLLRVINDILDFSKVEAGKLELEEIDFDLREVVEGATQLFAGKAQEKGLELASLVHANVPTLVRGDPSRLGQVLMNLIGNAIKFTDQGEVVIRARLKEESEGAATVTFLVTDTGIGISDDKMKKLFESFSQGDASMTRRFGGTGLGLAIARQLVDLMGGDIECESLASKGTTFSVTVPLKKQLTPAKGSLKEYIDMRGLRVLVVDDHSTNREIVHQQAHAWGCLVDEAASGEEALNLMRNAAADGRPFVVAVLDHHMPGMNGQELGRIIKSDSALKGIGLIMLSSLTDNHVTELREIGFSGVLTKPVRQSDLYDSIIVAANGALKHGVARADETAHGLGCDSDLILLAEDNEINYEVAREMLTSFGFQSKWVQTGRQSVDAVRSGNYAMILMDCQMPEMDGYEATRAIRREEGQTGRPRMPIVAMTAHAMKGDRERCIEFGMDDYMTKPLDPEVLADMVSTWIRPALAPVEIPEASVPTGEVFDKQDLLKRCMGKEDFVTRLLDKFLSQLDADVDMLRSQCEAGDAEAAATSAHRIKGSAANISAAGIRETAARIETAGRAGDVTGIRDAFTELPGRVDQFRAAVELEKTGA